MWFFNLVGWVWWLINWPTNFVLGDNLFDLVLEGMFVLLFVALCAIPVTFVVAVVRRVWHALGDDKRAFKRSSYKIAFVLTAILIVPPHLFMSWSLREYKTEFKYRATHVAHYEDFSNTEPGEPGEFDYGGKLDELVIARTQVLMRRQFVPYFTAAWRTQALGVTYVPGAYIYTYLPKQVYDSGVASIASWAGEDKTAFGAEFQKFLDESVWTPPTRLSLWDERFFILVLATIVLVFSIASYRLRRLRGALIWYGF